MWLASLDLSNFRSLPSEKVAFGPGANILVGPNSAGKSNVLRAVQLVLGTDTFRQREPISRLDFTDGNRDEEFLITATIRGLTDEDIDVFGVDNLEPCDANANLIEASSEIVVVDDNELVLRFSVVGSFDASSEEYSLVWFFTKFEDRQVIVSRSQRAHIAFQHLRGGEVFAASTLGLSANSMVRRLLTRDGGSLTAEAAALAQAVEGSVGVLDGNAALLAILERLKTQIARVLPIADSPLHYGMGRHSGDEIVRGLELVGDFDDSSMVLPFSAHGRGSVNSAVLMTVLLFAADVKGSLILALEEPEVALHPHLQRLILREFQTKGAQVILTTHSPVIVGASKPEDIILVRKEDKATKTRRLVVGAAHEASAVERELNRILAEAVFSRAVLLVEGETDVAFVQTLDARLTAEAWWDGLDALGVTILETGNCANLPDACGKLECLSVPRFGVVDNDPGQPIDSVRDWGSKCELYFSWPRHDCAYDLEGMIAWSLPLDVLSAALDQVAPHAGGTEVFLKTVVNSAFAIDSTSLHPWLVTTLNSGAVTISAVVEAWAADPSRPSEPSLRKAIKGAMSGRLKQRRLARLMAVAIPLASFPEPLISMLRDVQSFMKDEIGLAVREFTV